MIIKTVRGNKFDTSKPAKSNLTAAMVLDDNGHQVMDSLRLTGKQTIVLIDMEQVSMVEVEGTFGKFEICEDFLWQ